MDALAPVDRLGEGEGDINPVLVDVELVPGVAKALVVVAVERVLLLLITSLECCVSDEVGAGLVEPGVSLEGPGLDGLDVGIIGALELEVSPSVDVGVGVGVREDEPESLAVGLAVAVSEALVLSISETLDVVSAVVVAVELAVSSTNATPNSAITASSGGWPSPPKKTSRRPMSET